MLALERRNLILEKLLLDKRVVVGELSQLYDVSEETIRRDLEKLVQDGYATKSYGGAVLNENIGLDLPLNLRSKKNVPAKQVMAELAAELIHDGDHIMLDASSTDLFVARAIKNKQGLTVVTNSVEILLELTNVTGWNIVSTGGSMKEGYVALVGSKSEESLRSYHVDKAVVSCRALNMEYGIMESLEDFTNIKRVMLQSSEKRIMLLDSSKFDRSAYNVVGPIKMIDVVITDAKPDEKWLKEFEKYGIECIYPE